MEQIKRVIDLLENKIEMVKKEIFKWASKIQDVFEKTKTLILIAIDMLAAYPDHTTYIRS